MKSRIARVGGLILLTAVLCTAASAQVVFLGRKVVGKITNLSQPRDATNPGYEAATVILEADAAKVYATALDLLQKNPKLAITSKDEREMSVIFKEGDWSCELQVTSLGDHLAQILVVSGAGPGQGGGTSQVLDAVKRICDQLGVKVTIDTH